MKRKLCFLTCIILVLVSVMIPPLSASADSTIYNISPADGATVLLGSTVTLSACPGGTFMYHYIAGQQINLPYRLYFRVSHNGKTDLFEYRNFTNVSTKLEVPFTPAETGEYTYEIQRVVPESIGNLTWVYLQSEEEFVPDVTRKFTVKNPPAGFEEGDDPDVPYNTAEGTVLAATRGAWPSECAQYMFDGNPETKLCVTDRTAFVIWKSPKACIVTGYQMTTGNDTGYYTDRNPVSWTLYGSNSQLTRRSSGWEVIHTVKNDTTLQPVDMTTFTFNLSAASKKYAYFRLELEGAAGITCMQLSDFKLITKAPISEVTESGGHFSLDQASQTAQYTGPADSSATVSIPASVTAGGETYPVTSIADGAFANNKTITKVTIGKNVKTIGKKAFYGCTKLAVVAGGANVTTIGDEAFRKCTALTAFTIGKKVTTIGKGAFNGCKNLAAVAVKTKTLTENSIGKNAFKGISKKAVFKCPNRKLAKSYKKIFVKKGAPKTATFK